MEIITLPVEDEWPHQATREMLWQESIVLTWQDVGQSIGGVIRLGHNPNRQLGICTFGIVEANGTCFNRSAANIPIDEADRFANGFSIGGFLRAEFSTGSSRWSAHDQDCDFELTCTDLHPLYDTWALVGLKDKFREKFASSHTEVAALVSGSLRLGDRHWSISGYGYRDHSWGVRDHSHPAAQLVNLFWLVGSFDKELIVCACETVSIVGGRFATGFVIKDGLIDRPVVKDVKFIVEADGISTRGARCVLETSRFGQIDLDIEGFGNVLLGMQGDSDAAHSYFECGMPGRMRWNGCEGGMHVSTMFNARASTRKPVLLHGASMTQGLYTAPRWTPCISLDDL